MIGEDADSGALEIDPAMLRAVRRSSPLPQLLLRPLVDEKERVFDFSIVLENPAARALHRPTEGELLLSQLIPAAEGAGVIAHLRQCQEKGEAPPHEFSLRGPDGTIFFSLVPTLLGGNIFVTLVDVTGQRIHQTENAQRLAEEQELYRVTFTDAPIGIAHLDGKGAFIEVNERLVELFGFSREELLSMTFAELPRPPGETAEALPGGNGADVEDRVPIQRRFLKKNGDALWTSLTISTVSGRSGLLPRYIAIIEDVSAVARANSLLVESSRSKDEFLAVLGHELRNPLAALRHASLLLSEPGDHDYDKVVQTVERETKHMARLVDDLLDIGRIAKGKFDFRMEQVDMRQIVSFALDDLEAGALPPQHLDVSLDPGPLWIRGDSARLLQAIQNLLNNAVKYTPATGNIQIKLEKRSDSLVFSVADDGVGLEESFSKKLFMPFEQEPQNLSRSQGGLGLGLALASEIIKHHRGTIVAESAGRGQGATFTVELPRDYRKQSPPPKPEPTPIRRFRFLLIEDHRDAAELLEMLLTARGHEVSLCFSGDAALDAALAQIPDVIICDLGLPGLSGFEVAKQIRREPRLQKTVLLALSGYGRPEDVERSLSAGFASHLTKPADANQILAEIERLLTPEQRRSFSVPLKNRNKA